jgi:hypothetical protein
MARPEVTFFSAAARPSRRPSQIGQGQEEQLGALGLIVNTIVPYNTIYPRRVLDHITATTGSAPGDEDIERLSPAWQRPHNAHRTLPRPPARATTRPRRLPGPQHPRRRGRRLMGNTILSELYRLQVFHPSAYGRRPPQLNPVCEYPSERSRAALAT